MRVVLMLLLAGCGEGSLPPADAAAPPDATDEDAVMATPSCVDVPIGVTEIASIASASDNYACAGAQAAFPWKDGAAGSPCAGPLDCAPVCCACAFGARHAVTSWCDHGACATAERTCCALLGTATKSCGINP